MVLVSDSSCDLSVGCFLVCLLKFVNVSLVNRVFLRCDLSVLGHSESFASVSVCFSCVSE